MKLKTLTVLVASAFAGVATTASAGTIQASYKNYAAEVFGDNSVELTAPTINYALATPLSGTGGNPNTFQISWTIDNGQWKVAPPKTAVVLADPTNVTTQISDNVVLSPDGKTLTATFTLDTGFLYTVGSQIVLGTGPLPDSAVLTKIGSILGAPATNTDGCTSGTAQVNVSVKLTNAAGAEFDSSRADATNTTPLAQSKVAIGVTAMDSAKYALPAAVPPGPGPELSKVDVLTPSLGTKFTTVADVTLGSPTLLNIGAINIADKTPNLYDLGGGKFYSTLTAGFATNPGAPNDQVGIVSANGLTVKVSGTFVTTANGGSITANTDSACGAATAIGTGTITLDGKSATLTLTDAQLAPLQGAAGVAPIYICYTVPGNKQIPTAQFKVDSGQLTKFSSAKELANPVCPGSIYNLVTNGVRVDRS